MRLLGVQAVDLEQQPQGTVAAGAGQERRRRQELEQLAESVGADRVGRAPDRRPVHPVGGVHVAVGQVLAAELGGEEGMQATAPPTRPRRT